MTAEPIGELGNPAWSPNNAYLPRPKSKAKEEPPLLFEPVKLYRHWRVIGDKIATPIHGQMLWTNGENKARCDQYRCFSADCPYMSSFSHNCGFYGVWEETHQYAEDTNTYAGVIFGVVEFYGKVILGTQGARASHARIGALHLPPDGVNTWERLRRVKNGLFENYPDVRFYRDRYNLIRAEKVKFPKELIDGYQLGGTFG